MQCNGTKRRATQNEIEMAAWKRADRRRRGYERALDCLHVRLLPPLVGICLALTLVFMAAWLDGDLEVSFTQPAPAMAF